MVKKKGIEKTPKKSPTWRDHAVSAGKVIGSAIKTGYVRARDATAAYTTPKVERAGKYLSEKADNATTSIYESLVAREKKLCEKRVPRFYKNHRQTLDAVVIGTAATVSGAEASAQILDTSLVTGGVATGAAIAYGTLVGRIGEYVNNKFGYKAAAAVYSTGAVGAAVGLHKLLHLEEEIASKDFVMDTIHRFSDYGMFGIALAAGYYVGKKILNATTVKTKNIGKEKKDTEKKAFFKRTGRTTMALAGLSYIVGHGVYCGYNAIPSEYPTDATRHDDIGMRVIVSKNDDNKDGKINDGELMTIDVKATKAGNHVGKDLTIRYFMLPSTEAQPTVPKAGAKDFYDDLIYLGERNDFSIDQNGIAVISGIFEYDAGIENAFVPDTAMINPLAGKDAQKIGDDFKFLVEVWDGKKKVDHKWFGSEKGSEYVFTFEKEGEKTEEPQPPIVRVSGDGKKHVFIYNQALGSGKMEEETLAVVDYWHPHTYEFVADNRSTLRLKQRCSEKLEEKIITKAHGRGVKVLPMVSAFTKSLVQRILDNPSTAADRIADAIKEEGYDGVAVDLETISLGSESSAAYVEFMRRLRQELPAGQYEIAVAVSPRFEGSEKAGYKHHGFYDYQGLAKYADFLHIMAYDFHKGRRGASPVLPNDKIDDIIAYAQARVANDQIVFLMPLYGYVWTKGGSAVGTISAQNNQRYIDAAKSTGYSNGELRIETADRIAYLQDSKVFEDRLQLLDSLNVNNVGGWRQTHGTKGIYNEFGEWKQQ
ncbi:hypothetical protein HZC31_05140 [Candidatus Woesearchaeota archaeon]|nr:hypothetical protein [Candidatus Woesearchaeota archaeon]